MVLPAELVSALVVTAEELPDPDPPVVVAEPEAAPVAGLALRPVKPEAARLPAPVAVPDAVMAEVAGSAEYELLGPEAAPAQ